LTANRIVQLQCDCDVESDYLRLSVIFVTIWLFVLLGTIFVTVRLTVMIETIFVNNRFSVQDDPGPCALNSSYVQYVFDVGVQNGKLAAHRRLARLIGRGAKRIPFLRPGIYSAEQK
jgi:hypothetical protein